jgi:hypothetical protein
MISDSQLLLGLFFSLIVGLTFLFKKFFKIGFDGPNGLIWTFSLILSLVSSSMLILIIFPSIRWINSDTTTYYSKRTNIASIKNSNEVGGHFTLGCGNIEQTEYYYYYYESIEGFKRGKKEVNQTVIVENGSERPHTEVKMIHFESKSKLFKYSDEELEQYKIVVPKGTVVNKFEVY